MKKNSVFRKLWYGLSTNQRYIVRKFYYLPLDTWDYLIGKRHKYVPPRGYIYTGSPAGSDAYLEQGEQQLKLLIKNINLEPTDDILDIGSGVGRTAIALTNFLSQDGSYQGFDVVKSGVDWCKRKISKDYPNFKFVYVPLFNNLYNNATQNATEFIFPYKDHSVNKIVSFSVFTHMGIDEIQHYFVEIKRVLKPGGLCFSTFFLYDDTSENHIIQREKFNFPYAYQGYRLMDDKVTSGNIAIHKDTLKAMLEAADMELVRIEDGHWKSTNNNSGEYQDIIIFK